MDTMLLRLFQDNVARQCEYALRALRRIHEAPYGDQVWADLQTVAVAAAILSKLLWSQRGRHADRRLALRESLGVTDASPLNAPATVRDALEHVDEKLDHWWSHSASRNIGHHNIGPPGAIVGLEEGDRFQHWDPTTGSLWFWGARLDLGSVEEELLRLGPVARREANRPPWDP